MTLSIVIIAFALSLDAFAVSVTNGICIKRLHIRHALRVALSFGIFQAVMPMVGWLAGFGVKSFMDGVDHWIAFGLLTAIGIKMIWESRRLDTEKVCPPDPELGNMQLFMLSIATSIDALAVGLTLPLLSVSIFMPALIIGGITFAVCLFGVYAGNRLGHILESKIEIVGGLILIGIGLKILLEHLKIWS
ncbi:MAG TPA: manganese efflux pump MntP family protein [Candidatus Sumerlaeota bacterium]|nr:manganese efflux pump MntP family protein [Candidatus Sumerlaeota bacterium]HRR31789.1 manganese efflux pump MntP family protein [Candidatus Sumerlaeia bacterium]HON50674.1 manganese efflux pump MntP family protein [Candidatus Sumerlaeota bacterium]HOR65208.1 manganese efflux pump MntP family protein [Candidatus Sumerlaeota bacterium]HPL75163.1 manganese efflux pump MntP family protein [Candidatus Sumerlaeota bacterium]